VELLLSSASSSFMAYRIDLKNVKPLKVSCRWECSHTNIQNPGVLATKLHIFTLQMATIDHLKIARMLHPNLPGAVSVHSLQRKKWYQFIHCKE
jgi:hypothetical protein